jgi:hypothetical protein
MPARGNTAREREEAANLARQKLTATIDQLGRNLQPRTLLDEMARGVGMRDISPASALEFVGTRYPIPTLLIAMGLGFWAYSVVRSPRIAKPDLRESVRATVAKLTDSGINVFRERAEARRETLLAKAQSHVAAGTAQLSDVIDKNVDNLVGSIPKDGNAFRPLVESAIHIAMLVVLEVLLPQQSTRAPAE